MLLVAHRFGRVEFRIFVEVSFFKKSKQFFDILNSTRPCRLWAEIEAHKWRDLELNLSKTVEELRQDSQLIQANSMKKLRDNKKLLECSFAQI